MANEAVYEVFAVKYAERVEGRRRGESFIRDDAPDAPHPIDFYVWLARGAGRTIVIDTGFDEHEARQRGRRLLRTPARGLAALGVDADTVADVVITHLHFDHAGSLGDFPAARFHLQEDEMAYATGPCMAHADANHAYTADHVCAMVRNVFSGRVAFVEGDAEIAPNLTVHKIGGHTKGMQCVRVLTRRGWVVLASDAAHFYENFEQRRLFPIVHNAELMLKGFERLERLADSREHVVPGHDPLVRARYPAVSEALDGIVHRLDVAPLA